jgi:hypothetical protein
MDSLYSRLAEQWNVLFPPDADRVIFLTIPVLESQGC